MAAYAAVASLGQTLDQILNSDTHINLYNKRIFETLRQKVQFLQNFLENCARGVDGFEILAAKIRDAAYEAEDIIELQVYDFKVNPYHITPFSVNIYPKMLAFLQIMMPCSRIYDVGLDLMDEAFHDWPYHGLVELIEGIDHMLVEAKEISERCSVEQDLQTNDHLSVGPSRVKFVHDSVLVGIEDDLDILKDRLTGPELKLEVVPIVGMGGIGKTTLAENIYRDSLIVYHFNVRAWVTVSQVYDVKDILLQLLGSLGIKENDEMLMKREDELALQVHKILYSRRYLIVMDDLWSTKAWDDFKKYFRNYGNGSRIILTTRIESVALHASSSGLHFMNHLCPFNSWKLLQDKVFKEEECPSQLHAVGKHIVFHCRGLPLAIVVIAGILINVNRTIDEWKKVAEYMHSITNRYSDTCLEILFLSYSHLPQHLKPCFLYMGVFPEDSKIAMSKVIKLWVAEGFLKQNEARTVEEVAEDYILELAQRSLISVFRKRRRTHKFGRMKTISVHDLLRDLCIREAQKEKLLHVIKSPGDGFPREMNHQRCVCIYPNIPLEDPFFKCLKHLSTTRVFSKPISFARSLVYTGVHPFPSPVYQYCFRLLKVLDISQVLFFEFPLEILTLYNLRYLAFSYHGEIPDSISRLWNLQTLIFSPLLKSFSPCPIPLPLALWSMPRLRHLRFHVLYLSDFPCVLSGWRTGVFLANLQTLTEVSATFCQEEILKEMPNLKKLGIWMEKWDDAPFYINSNLACLEKLEVLKCSVRSCRAQRLWYQFQQQTCPVACRV